MMYLLCRCELQYLVLVSMHSPPDRTHSWPLTFPPQWTWTTKTWTTSWTTTGSVLYPCRPSPKLHREVPKKIKNPNPPFSPGRPNSPSVILALSPSSVLPKPPMAQPGTRKTARLAPAEASALIVHSVYLTYLLVRLWMNCNASPSTLYLGGQ